MEQSNEGVGATRGPSFEDGRRWTIAEDVRSRRIAGETVILRLDTEQYFGLSGVGSRLWALLGPGTGVDRAVEVLVGDYEVDPALVRADVYALLGHLLESELVVVTPEPGDSR